MARRESFTLVASLQKLKKIAEAGGFTAARRVTLQQHTSYKNGNVRRRNYKTTIGDGYVFEAVGSRIGCGDVDPNRFIRIDYVTADEAREATSQALVTCLRDAGVTVEEQRAGDGAVSFYFVRVYAPQVAQ